MRTAVFIDGHWLHKTSAALGFDVDFKRLHAWYEDHETCSIEYFAIEATRPDGTSTVRKLLDWLECNGFRVRSIPVDIDQRDSIRDTRSEMMVWLALSMVNAAERGIERIDLWTNDRSMIRAVSAAQQSGAFVTLVAEFSNCPGTLMRAADSFVEIAGLKSEIEQARKVVA